MATTVRANVYAYSATHVATGLLRGLKLLIAGCGLDVRRMVADWEVLERGLAAWLESRHLEKLVLEVFDPTDVVDDRRGRFDFTIEYVYYQEGDGEFWLDPDTVRWVIQKNGSFPSECDYRIVARTAPGAPKVPGWGATTLRSTSGMTRHTAGTAMGGGSIGATLAYYRRG